MASTVAPRASFEEVFDFYRASGFLYPAKLAALAPRLTAIEDTWRRLLAADPELFHFVANEGSGGLSNAICAFEYAPGTWQGQHLVSRHRHEYQGTLTVLTRLVQGFHDDGVEHARLSYRPDNPGSGRLFGLVTRRVPRHLAHVSVVDYGLVVRAGESPVAPGVTVDRVGAADAAAALRFYADALHPVELASLRLDDLGLDGLGARFAAHGLERSRAVFVADGPSGVVGACIVNRASEGINFSFLENAVEHLRVAPDLPAARRRQVWRALAAAAVRHALAARPYAALTLDPADRALAVEAGLVPPRPKQYAVLTVSRRERGFLRSIESFQDYYRRRLAR